MRFVVTTSYKPTKEEVSSARELAEELGVKYVSRSRLKQFESEHSLDSTMYFDKNGQLTIRNRRRFSSFTPECQR
jgi:hypothetical protein